MPVATSPLRMAVAHQLALQVPRRRAPAVGPQAGRDGDQPAAAFGMPHREGDADHAAEAGADEGHRRRAAAAVEPRRHQIGEARAPRSPAAAPVVVESAPGRSVAGPARTEHGHARRVDEVGAEERRPPRVGAALRLALAVAERKRRRGDPADDDDHRCGAQLRPVGPAAERDVAEHVAVDGDVGAVDVEAARDDGGEQGLGHGEALAYTIKQHIYIGGY